jgi:CRISPR/Cas system CSM-associated protein Csm2 small subunit
MEIAKANITDIETAIERGLDFLYRNQLPSGEFKSYRSTHPTMDEDCEFDSSPFPTSLIAYSLSFSESPKAKEMLNRATKFLLSEMESVGVWRYWTSEHQYHNNIPPDLDDTVCVSSVLKQNGVTFPDNQKLILANRNRQGLFYTWLVPRFSFPLNTSYWRVVLREAMKPISLYYFWKLNESEPNDIDCVVNANVLFYLGKSESTKPVIDYLIRVIEQQKEECCDKWHLSRFNLYYAISRNYFAGIEAFESVRDEVIKRIISFAKDDGIIGNNILETALAVCSLLNWHSDSPEMHNAVKALLAAQKDSGEWQRFPLYYGGPKKYFGWGSEEITTSFCLEALMRSFELMKN